MSAERDRAVKIATVALHRAMAGDMQGAAAYIDRLNGTNGLLVAIVAWIDTYIANVYPECDPTKPIRLAWYSTVEGRLETAEEVSPALRWAGRLFTARAADDEDGFYAVLHSMPEGAALGDGITTLLHCVATGLKDPGMIRAASGLARHTSEGS